jgi:predicted ArsR family transcriptional regulator
MSGRANGPTEVSLHQSLGPDEFEAAVSSITAAFGDPTRRQIYLMVQAAPEGMTASEVAAAVDLHANVARHHLEKLAAAGQLTVQLGKPAGGAGRPSKRYCAAPSTGLNVGLRRDDLLGTLLARALARLPRHEAEALAEEVGADFGRAIAQAVEPGHATRSLRAAVGTVADALTSYGFAAHAEGDAGELRIVSEHCPFGRAAIDNPVLCAIDRGLVKGMLATLHGSIEPQLAGSVPMGDTVCTTTV